MDFGRAPYKADCRFFRDSGVVDQIRWYEVQSDAPAINRTTAIYRREWDNDQWAEVPVGELPDQRKRFLAGVVPRGLPGVHVCGTDLDFAEGGTYAPDVAPVAYGVSGWPLCCDPPVTLRGGPGGGARVHPSLVTPGVCGGFSIDCATTGLSSPNTDCHYHVDTFTGHWVAWNVGAGVTVTVTITKDDPSEFWIWSIENGDSCATITHIFGSNGTGPTITHTFTTLHAIVYFQWSIAGLIGFSDATFRCSA